jgi:hypothetical protein
LQAFIVPYFHELAMLFAVTALCFCGSSDAIFLIFGLAYNGVFPAAFISVCPAFIVRVVGHLG